MNTQEHTATIVLSTAQELDVPETGAVGTCTIIDTLLNNCNNVQATLLPFIIHQAANIIVTILYNREIDLLQ